MGTNILYSHFITDFDGDRPTKYSLRETINLNLHRIYLTPLDINL